jgi:Na+-driven multidrug efflux pump
MISVVVSMSIGLIPRLSQAFGAKDYKLLGFYLHKGFINTIIMLVPSTFLMIYSDKIFIWANYTPELAEKMQLYLSQVTIAGFFFAMGQTFQVYLNACGCFKSPVVITIIGSVTFIGANFVFVDLWKWGLNGVALACNI